MTYHTLSGEEAMQKETYRGATLINRTRRWDGWHVTENGRTRWGTLREVQADVDHLLIWGHLPESKNGWA